MLRPQDVAAARDALLAAGMREQEVPEEWLLHPVPTALSHATHNSFAGSGREDAYTRLATLGPGDPGVFQPGYADGWESLSPFERCLFWWTEVHLSALELVARLPQVRVLRVASERMLAGEQETLRELTGFAGLPWDERLVALTAWPVDRWHHHTDVGFDPARICLHPVSVAVAGALGYRLSDTDPAGLRARYTGTPQSRAEHRVAGAGGTAMLPVAMQPTRRCRDRWRRDLGYGTDRAADPKEIP
jgi:hypothetical protein